MFGFKAYFWDEQVCIGDQVYQNNEILTAYLNLPYEQLKSDLAELQKLRGELVSYLENSRLADMAEEFRQKAIAAAGRYE